MAQPQPRSQAPHPVTPPPVPQEPSAYTQGIIEYYSEAGMDYEPWSRRFNMHFGYYRWGLNPFNREQMLDEMNHQILDRLALNPDAQTTLADLGCGVGTSARYAIRTLPKTSVIAATIVPKCSAAWPSAMARTMASAPACTSSTSPPFCNRMPPNTAATS
ncbi:MAG: hypothetical protein AAGJ85_05400, partial [Pseudomonadota bacterium]